MECVGCSKEVNITREKYFALPLGPVCADCLPMKEQPMTCATCKFYVKQALELNQQGECYARPPTAHPIQGPNGAIGAVAIYPPVKASNRACGMWSRDPDRPFTPPPDVVPR